MWFILGLLIGAVGGFIGGFLCFRNNAAKINAKEQAIKTAGNAIKDAVK